MVKDCFYYGTYSPCGFYSLVKKPNFCSCDKILIHGNSDGVKQQLFDCVKSKFNCIELMRDDKKIGIFCKEKNVVVADGCFADFENYCKFDLSGFQNNTLSECKADGIISEKNKALAKCRRFLSACNEINSDAIRIDSQSIDHVKLNRYTTNLWKRYGGNPKGRIGRQSTVLVSCITADGCEVNYGAFNSYCKKIIAVCDKTGACSHLIADRLRRYALGAGYDVINCVCPMNPKVTEHIIVPELKFGVFSSEYYHRADFENCRKCFASRFHTPESEKTKQRVNFTLKAYHSLMCEVFDSIKQINACDRMLDGIFIPATDIRQAEKELLLKICG